MSTNARNVGGQTDTGRRAAAVSPRIFLFHSFSSESNHADCIVDSR